MRVKKIIVKWVVMAAVALPCGIWAQTSSINAFSPYSMYGIGELQTQGALPTRSMGGAGLGMRSSSRVNLLNPAAYSATAPKTFLFDFGVEGQNFYNRQQRDGQTLRTSYNTFNFHDIALQLPITRGLGLGFSLTPYSSVGYRVAGTIEDDEIWGNIGRVQQLYSGEGDITEVKLGLGWEIFKNFSIGVAAQYYWGEIDRSFTTTVVNNVVGAGSFTAAIGKETYGVSRFKGQVGLQWNIINDPRRRVFTLGATYDIGGDVRPDITRTVYSGNIFGTTVLEQSPHLKLVLPHQVAAGLYYQTSRIQIGADYVYQDWGSGNKGYREQAASGFEVAYRNTSTVKVGIEWTPNRLDVRRLLKRWSYRAGFRYGNYNQTFGGKTLTQYAITAGIGIPLKIMGASHIDLGVEYGRRGGPSQINDRVGLVKQQYFKFAVGISMFGEDYWFVRPKYD